MIAEVTYQAWLRLTDANYEPDLSRPWSDTDGDLNPLLLPSLEQLVTSGWLPPGTLLEPVTEDGYIKVGDHTCETVDIAAREANADVESGWEFWRALVEGADEPILLADLRVRAAQEGLEAA